MASDIWLRTILIVRKETRCRHIGYSFRLMARVLLYAPSHRQDSTYHGLCYTSCGTLVGTRNSSIKDGSDDPSHHERTLLPWSYISLPHLELLNRQCTGSDLTMWGNHIIGFETLSTSGLDDAESWARSE